MDVQIDIHLRKLIGNDYHFYQKFIVTDNGKRFEEFLFNDKRGRGKCFERSTKGYWLQSHLSFDLKSLLPKQDLYSDNTIDDPGDFFGRIQEPPIEQKNNRVFSLILLCPSFFAKLLSIRNKKKDIKEKNTKYITYTIKTI